ncbi:MAG: glycosyltransferase family 4 protein [Chthoniobacterales bacterium]
MKFLFLSSYAHLVLDPESTKVSGGAELQIALLAHSLAQRSHEVVVVGGDIGQVDGRVLQGVKTRTGGKFHTCNPLDSLSALPRIFRILKEERPDYVFLLGWTAWLFVLLLLKKFFGYKLGFICGLDTEVSGEFRKANPFRGALFEYGVRHSDLRYAMTEDQRSMFHKNGQDCGFYRNLILPRAFPRDEKKSVDLLWVARCQPIKRPHVFLDLVESMPEVTCEMICPCEDQDLWESVRDRAAKLSNVTFHNGVPYHEVQTHYDAARVFINTSEFEGWPNSFIQSGLGYTAIASLSVNPDHLLETYRAGGFANHQVDALKKIAVDLLRDPAALDHAQTEAARFVQELHSNDKNTDDFLAGLSAPSF